MRSFFVLSDREKATPTTHPQRATKTQREQQEGNKGNGKGQKSRSKRQKEGQTRHKPLIRLTPHAYKAPQAKQSTQPTQTHTKRPKPAKNALKTRNKTIFKGNAPRAKR